MSSISRLRSPVFWWTASRVSSCSASSTSPLRPTSLLRSLAAVDADDRAVTLDVEVDVAVEVEQVQQLLEVVAGDLALGHQALLEVLAGGRHRFVAVL